MTPNVQELVLIGFGVFACFLALGMAVATMRGTKFLTEARRQLQESEELNRNNGIYRMPLAAGQTVAKGDLVTSNMVQVQGFCAGVVGVPVNSPPAVAMVSLDGNGEAGVFGTCIDVDSEASPFYSTDLVVLRSLLAGSLQYVAEQEHRIERMQATIDQLATEDTHG